MFTDHTDDVDVLAERLAGTEALVLIRERTQIRAPLIERLPALAPDQPAQRLPAHRHRGVHPPRGASCRSNLHAGSPSYATAELTWGLVLGCDAPDPPGGGRDEGGPVAERPRHDAAGQDPRDLQLRADRQRGRRLRRRLLAWT